MLDDDVIVERAPAKLNLALHVRRRRADGYHDLETLFAFAKDGDSVTVARAEADSFAITGPFAAALDSPHPRPPAAVSPSPASGRGKGPAREASGRGEGLAGEGDNLVTRAARAFTDAFGVSDQHAITLDKQLPVASGIGGGSADAAATLRALARLHDVAPSAPELTAIAASLGADVPACLVGRTAFGTGRGDALVPLEPLGGVPALLVNPGVAVSTAAVFARWDGVDRGGIGEGAVLDRAREGRNDLQSPALAIAPVIGEVLARLEAMPGATLVRMSGSGATCFALFDTAVERADAARALEKDQPGWWLLETALA